MRKLLPLLLLFPLLSRAQQPVKPIVSPDYLSLIQNDSLAPKKPTTSSPPTQLQIKEPFPDQIRIKIIKEKNNVLTILPAKTKWLTIGGNYTFSAGATSVNTDNNDIFKTGQVITHSISILANIKSAYWTPIWAFSLKAAQNTETLVIPDNRNTSRNGAISVERTFNKFSIKASYDYFHSNFSTDNSYGFLNQAYENALLTKTPWLLLKDNDHSTNRTQQTGNLSLQKKAGNLTAGINNTLDVVTDTSNMYRRQKDHDYSSNAWLAYHHYRNGSEYNARLNYIYNDEKATISYPTNIYSYHRSSSDVSSSLSYTYTDGYIHAGINAANNFYLSNTTLHDKFFLPGISGFISSDDLFDYFLRVKIAGTYTSFCSEPPINRSSSSYMLTQLAPQDAARFAPTTEVETYNNLAPMQHREFTSSIHFEHGYIVSLHGEFSIRDTKDNIFPVYANNQLTLKNLADTRYKSFELQLQINSRNRHPHAIETTNNISFYKFSNIVTRIQGGYNNHPLAGFSTVYKALVIGRPVGVIIGESAHQDALTLLNNQAAVIGDPTPDFTLKFAHTATWKAFSVNLDWEYRKGGDIWNGTAAALDHSTGIASTYIQKGDNIRIHTLSLAYEIKTRTYLQKIRLTAYTQNLLLWSAYKGVDPNQLLYDQAGTAGLDFFNLPSTKTYGISASLQF